MFHQCCSCLFQQVATTLFVHQVTTLLEQYCCNLMPEQWLLQPNILQRCSANNIVTTCYVFGRVYVLLDFIGRVATATHSFGLVIFYYFSVLSAPSVASCAIALISTYNAGKLPDRANHVRSKISRVVFTLGILISQLCRTSVEELRKRSKR